MQTRRGALVLGLVLLLAAVGRAAPAPDEAARLQARAAGVEILRDRFGIAHVYGHTDADAVFGMSYAQAEDDFHRIEHNYLVSLGWLAQAEGEGALYSDLRARLFVDADALRHRYAGSPAWLKRLMEAWADGLNYYLARHPQVTAQVIRHFEPWMALSFTEGSIGGDIESIDLHALEAFYGGRAPAVSAAVRAETPPGGSNGFAIAPARSASGHALLWINPHTSFYFRSELQMVSDEGLDVYGAVTWGQFFVYQGFNAHNGWMHTSYGGDAIDEYAETLVEQRGVRYYRYGAGRRRLDVRQIRVPYRDGATLRTRSFTVYHSHHGPIVRAEGARWIAVRILQDPVHALAQSYLRTKTRNYAEFYRTQQMRTDTSNNTVYADADGTIAYFHGNFIPKRDPAFDYAHVVDGSDPRTEWQGAHALEETILLKNPASGWLMNTNNWPFSAAGASSPKPADYPPYMWIKGENPRGLHAVEVLEDLHAVTLDSLIAAGYDPHLTGFETLLPPLLAALDALPATDPQRAAWAEPLALLRAWDRRTGAGSVATTLAIFWAQEMAERDAAAALKAERPVYDDLVATATDPQRLAAFGAALERLQRDFGRWQVPWGEVNRFQRRDDALTPHFDDAQPSLPVGFAPAQWGALASFDSVKPRSTRKIYGSSGNSFIAAVEFGPTVRARALMSGGASGDPASAHFTDQALMFSRGEFRDVYFYRADVQAHLERRYHP